MVLMDHPALKAGGEGSLLAVIGDEVSVLFVSAVKAEHPVVVRVPELG